MLMYVQQDIFKSPAQVIVNTVNTVGVMGKGIAKRYKEIYPDMYKQYQKFCEQHLLGIGKLWIYKSDTKWILNFPTKKHWRNPSKIEYVEQGLKKFVETYEEKGVTSVSFPQLGCGNGGLDWEKEVRPLMEKYLKDLPIDVFVHIYSDKTAGAEHMNVQETKKWLQSSPSNLSAEQVWDDLVDAVEADNQLVINDEKWEINSKNIASKADFSYDPESEPYLLMASEGKPHIFYQADLFELWIKLRETEFIRDTDFPAHFSRNEELRLVFNLLGKLDYIELAQVIDPNGKVIFGLTVVNSELPETDVVDREGVTL
ncbi:MAG: macro domain-containing protein [Trichococcus sp.]|uniref:macro domain-containing protein n=1 Tax=Trichococcus sp. TaxID=1985464 RepID=UPI003C5A29DA